MKLYKKNIKETDLTEYEYMRNFIPDEKLSCIDRYKNYNDRLRSVCGYFLALTAISDLEGIPVRKAKIFYDGNGKPHAADSSLKISISHCEDMVVCAAGMKNIGVDVEKIRRFSLPAAKRVCTEEELEYISRGGTVDDPEAQKRFFEIWTKKEAYGKRDGFGIGYDMKNHSVLDGENIFCGEYVIAVCEED